MENLINCTIPTNKKFNKEGNSDQWREVFTNYSKNLTTENYWAKYPHNHQNWAFAKRTRGGVELFMPPPIPPPTPSPHLPRVIME